MTNQARGNGKEKCQNNDVQKSKKVESTRRDEDGKASNQALSSNSIYCLLHFLVASRRKFLKDILAKKRRMNDYETIALTRATSNVFKNGVLEKMTNPRSFTVPCSISNMDLVRALWDLGASINLMPLSIFKKLAIKGGSTYKP
ncbi:uncharacterized protein E5676_scaffold451G001790 [Cucumis melo var. makuwa]|uniref:Uncharacterized protein n=1 Tax=Cucumis melo var. makuwa TaxID=1194695 RepID=A0A5D3BR70_CUCMM|nr:uncharacterized protein E5676_scaffold451G001790 [Cucumis melo var. makuwa]